MVIVIHVLFQDKARVDLDVSEFGLDEAGKILDKLAIKHGGIVGFSGFIPSVERVKEVLGEGPEQEFPEIVDRVSNEYPTRY